MVDAEVAAARSDARCTIHALEKQLRAAEAELAQVRNGGAAVGSGGDAYHGAITPRLRGPESVQQHNGVSVQPSPSRAMLASASPDSLGATSPRRGAAQHQHQHTPPGAPPSWHASRALGQAASAASLSHSLQLPAGHEAADVAQVRGVLFKLLKAVAAGRAQERDALLPVVGMLVGASPAECRDLQQRLSSGGLFGPLWPS